MGIYGTLWDQFLKEGGGIRTHGTLADTLVFKTIRYLVIAVDQIVSKELICPKYTRFIREKI